MTSEQELFLALLKEFSTGTKQTKIPEKVDWEILYEYAKDQSLLGICYILLRDHACSSENIPMDALSRFQEGFFNDAYSYANQRACMHELMSRIQETGIAVCPFKGWVVKSYWPQPELRTMGDIDILIHTEDRTIVNDIMMDLGYERYIDNHAVWSYHAQDILFEVHDHMFYEHLTNDVDYIGYFDKAWDYCTSELDESFHFLYLITHLAKHTVNKGMGFRAYMDLIFMCREAADRLNWDWICEELEKLKLLNFARTCLAFCREWFGFQPPIEVEELDRTFAEYVTGKMFGDGIFGLTNEQNEASSSAKEITHDQTSYLVGAVKLAMRRLFPPYRDMQLIPWYSFVDGRPWLMPVAWVYRWGYCLVHKRSYGAKLLTEPFGKRDIIEKRQKLIKDWGL